MDDAQNVICGSRALAKAKALLVWGGLIVPFSNTKSCFDITLSFVSSNTEHYSNQEVNTKTVKGNQGKSIYDYVKSPRSVVVYDNTWGLV
jgi:hypothetical protein